jgi:bacterioferritin-associated ferredoxin
MDLCSRSCNGCPKDLSNRPAGRLICRCLQVTEETLLDALSRTEIRTVKELRVHTGAGDGCTACHRLLQKYLEQQNYPSSSPICSVR